METKGWMVKWDMNCNQIPQMQTKIGKSLELMELQDNFLQMPK